MGPKGRPKGSRKSKLTLEEEIQLQASLSTAGTNTQQQQTQPDTQPKRKRGRPPKQRATPGDDGDQQAQDKQPAGGRPRNHMRDPEGLLPASDSKARTEPYPRYWGRPKPGDFPYECKCGKGERHWIHGVAEWEEHRNMEMTIKWHSESLAMQSKADIPDMYSRVYDDDNEEQIYPADDETEEVSLRRQGGLAGISHLPPQTQRKVVKERAKIFRDIIAKDKQQLREVKRARKVQRQAEGEERIRVSRTTVAARSTAYDSDYERWEVRRKARIRKLINSTQQTGGDERLGTTNAPGQLSSSSSDSSTDPEIQADRASHTRKRKAPAQGSTADQTMNPQNMATDNRPRTLQPSAQSDDMESVESTTESSSASEVDEDPLDPQYDEFDYPNAANQRMSRKQFASITLLQLQQDGGISTDALTKFTKLVRTLVADPTQEPTDYRTTRRRLCTRTNIKHVRYDVCIKGCFCYAPDLTAKTCPECDAPRSAKDFRDRVTYDHIPLIPRLRLKMTDPAYVKSIISYRKTVVALMETKGISSDFWSGKLHKKQREKGLFSSDTDQGFAFYTDGVQVFSNRVQFSVWPLVLVNLSLPPEMRYLEENIILIGIIPGPDGPVNLNSFLFPLYEEFKTLATGVENVFNGLSKDLFTMRGWICLVCADQKGREKIMGTSGVPAYAYCPYCHAHGYRGPAGTYCPYKAPLVNSKGEEMPPVTATADDCHDEDGAPLFYEIDIDSGAPLRTHEEYTAYYDHYTKYRDSEFTIRAFGINDFNILHNLTSLFSPNSYGVDEMHLLSINNGGNHFDLMRGVLFDRRKIDSINADEASANKPLEKPANRATVAGQKRKRQAKRKATVQANEDSSSDTDSVQWVDRRAHEAEEDEATTTAEEDIDDDDDDVGRKIARTAGHKSKKKKNKKRKDARLPKFVDVLEGFGLLARSWWAIGHDMDSTKSLGGIPTVFGYNIRSIARFCHAFKAEEWKTWYLRYAPIYLRGRLSNKHYLRNMDYTRLLQLCTQHYLTEEEIIEIQECTNNFLKYYEDEIYRRVFERVIVFKSQLHHLGHLAGTIRDCGPMYAFACWVIERVNGLIAKGARNRKDTNRNLSINALQREQFNHLKYTFSENSFRHDDSATGEDGSAPSVPTLPGMDGKDIGFGTADERACIFSAFKLYLDTLRDEQNLREGEEESEADRSEAERRRAHEAESLRQIRLSQRDKGMMKSRGRALKMKRAFEDVADLGEDEKIPVLTSTGKVQPLTQALKNALLKDQRDDWSTFSEKKDWERIRIRAHATCRLMMKGENSASEFSFSATDMRKKGTNRYNSLCLVKDIDAWPDEDGETPSTVAEVHSIFKVERKPKRKSRKFVNPNLIPEPVKEIPSDVYLLVSYYELLEDKSFYHIPEKPKPSQGIIKATDVRELIGFVVDRKQRVLVTKFGPLYVGGEFNPDLYPVEDDSDGDQAERNKGNQRRGT